MNVGETVAHAVGPVLQIEIDLDSLLFGIEDFVRHFLEMLGRRLPQLNAAMVFGALGEQVDDLSAARLDPVDRLAAVDETEDFHRLEAAAVLGPLQDADDCVAFALRNAGRTDFETVHLQAVHEHFGQFEFLGRSEGDAGSLFPVAQRGIHHFHVIVGFMLRFHLSLPCFFRFRDTKRPCRQSPVGERHGQNFIG